ncbi:MAG: phosphatidylglycerol lysyltransferase domain-containing protein [Helicobacteraceae bacterium]|jgi:hypothetical protein|nr:phosphatidylglycerol lysyltransferase domain-containing protein [Helicobacteraceae bacterium]
MDFGGIMEFEELNFKHQKLFDAALKIGEHYSADALFSNLYLWRFARKIEIASDPDFIFVKQTSKEAGKYFLAPIALNANADLKNALEILKNYAGKAGFRLVFRAVTATQKEAIQNALSQEFEFEFDRDHSDYIYSVSDLINLKGRVYHGKKNFVNRFAMLYGENYERISAANLAEAAKFAEEWFKRSPYGSNEEKLGILAVLAEFERFNLRGGLLRAQNEIAAITISEKLSKDRAVIHIEKANAEFQGAYQAINYAHLANEYADFASVNREEDLGIEGLRKAKLSYHPAQILEKFTARQNKDNLC